MMLRRRVTPLWEKTLPNGDSLMGFSEITEITEEGEEMTCTICKTTIVQDGENNNLGARSADQSGQTRILCSTCLARFVTARGIDVSDFWVAYQGEVAARAAREALAEGKPQRLLEVDGPQF